MLLLPKISRDECKSETQGAFTSHLLEQLQKQSKIKTPRAGRDVEKSEVLHMVMGYKALHLLCKTV